MISKKIQKALAGSSAIRAMFVEGNELAAKVGRENVYDFSLGNPATPAPAALNEAVRDLVSWIRSLFTVIWTMQVTRMCGRQLRTI